MEEAKLIPGPFSATVETHFAQLLGSPVRVTLARAGAVRASFRVAAYGDQPMTGALTFVTLGLSDQPLGEDGVRQELLLSVMKDDYADSLLNVLFGIGHHLSQTGEPAGYGDILDWTEPIVEGGPSHLLVYSPSHLGDDAETVPGNEPVDILWLIPITQSEADFVRDRGLDAFTSMLAKRDPDLFDLHRDSVV